MNPAVVLLLAFLIGTVAGLRALTAPAVVAWAIHLKWLDVHSSPLSVLGSPAGVAIVTLMALAELVGDKLPSTPSRTDPPGLIARIVLGGLSGAIVSTAGSGSCLLGGVLGAAGGIAGCFAGHRARTRSVLAFGVPDFVIAVLEDLIAIGAGLLVVSRF